MAFLLAQGGATLYKVDLTTGTATSLTLPTGVTLSTTRKPRFAVMKDWVIMTHSPSRNLAIRPDGTVRVLVPIPPTHGPDPDTGSTTGLTGTYRYRVSFIVKDDDGNLLMESPLSDYYQEISPAAQDVQLSDIPLSPDSITGRRLYRTLTGGTEFYYHLMDIDDNTTQTMQDQMSDAKLELLPTGSTALQSPPGTVPGTRFKNIIEWKSRLWAVSDDPDLLDTVYFTDTNKIYAWQNTLIAHPTGKDAKGIIGFAARQNQLGIIKRDGVWQIAASAAGTGISVDRISVQQIATGKAGSLSPDTIVSINDTVYWLGNDGVYEWKDGGVHNISDETVAPWFKGDTYFNRSRFPNAFAKYNELRSCYELHLAANGSSSEDRWVSFNLETRTWLGPHVTSEFTPSHATNVIDENGLPITLVGGTNGIIYTANSSLYKDGTNTAIDFDVYGPFHHAGEPDVMHYWGELSMLSRVEASGTLTITPYVGSLVVAAGTDISHSLTTGSQRLRRLGAGEFCRLRLRQNTVSVGCVLYGYEIGPVHVLGKR